MKILIAEDDAVSRAVLEAVLARLGHPCDVAVDGERAWGLYQRHRHDVLITDWMMPGMDGTELCRRVRDAGAPGYCYVIVLTALGDRDNLLAGMRAGADDYMTKPLQKHELEARLVAAQRLHALHDRLAAREAELEAVNLRLLRESRVDALTGLGNRHRLEEDLAALDARAGRYGQTYSAVLFDVDCFKAYNDGQGHLAGDDALRAIARMLAGECRSGDSAYRFGGEEILVLLPAQGAEASRIAAERIRSRAQALAIPHPGNPVGVVTVSAGVASERGQGSEDVLRRADEALYRAKAAGRNTVHVDAVGPAAVTEP